ncbi:MAG: nucleotidyltransferase family protein [Desertifilum sp.]|nr:nucleotidyltransferase family protein [Desertifilum sp.]
MQREKVLEIVRFHRETLEQLGVESLELFGSVARDRTTSESDVDFLVEFSISAGLFELFRVKRFLEEILGCKVDLGTKDSLREHLRKPVLEDVIRAI